MKHIKYIAYNITYFAFPKIRLLIIRNAMLPLYSLEARMPREVTSTETIKH